MTDLGYRIGVDVGGTFTDLVVEKPDGATQVFKVPSVPSAPQRGVLSAVAVCAAGLDLSVRDLLERCDTFVHGSTVATNAVLERKGAKVGMLTTWGFRDSLEIRRGIRENPWDHRTPWPDPLVPRHLRLGVRGRINSDGVEVEPLDLASIETAIDHFRREGVEAVAICFLNSYLNGAHEAAAAREIAKIAPDLSVSVSHELAPIMGEYERGSTTVVDAFVRPQVVAYLDKLAAALRAEGFGGQLAIIVSNGGSVPVSWIPRAPVTMSLSGPAAGVGAMRHFGRLCGSGDLLAMEIGGTSCDVTMLQDGKPQLVQAFSMSGFHVGVSSVEIHTVGAGGGSIASVDSGGLMRVGPEGAGSDPGPACYGRGGENPTTTDALVILGRMRAGPIGDGSIVVDPKLARQACQNKLATVLGISVEDAAIGMLKLLEQHLLQAVEEISLKRGYDPGSFTLIAAGGAGPAFGASVGRALGCKLVYVPRNAGTFCALGMLDSDLRQDFAKVSDLPLDESGLQGLLPIIEQLSVTAYDELGREGFPREQIAAVFELDLIYKSQIHPLRVEYMAGRDTVADLQARFEADHKRIYGHIKPITPISISAVRMAATVVGRHLQDPKLATAVGEPTPVSMRDAYVGNQVGWAKVPVYSGVDLQSGHNLEGPLLIDEQTTTIFVGEGDKLEVDISGNYRIIIA